MKIQKNRSDSLYPSLGITLGLYPAHLSAAFPKIYKEAIVDPRLKAKKEGDMVMADGFKLAANSVNLFICRV